MTCKYPQSEVITFEQKNQPCAHQQKYEMYQVLVITQPTTEQKTFIFIYNIHNMVGIM